jgi:hypothetical protein
MEDLEVVHDLQTIQPSICMILYPARVTMVITTT